MALKIGELAKAAGITVRSLHHYDSIGLLSPSGERESGHRLYTNRDVEKLGQILAFKNMGLSLKTITVVLTQGTYDLRKTLLLQKEALKAQITDLQKAKQTLNFLLDKLSREEDLTTKELLSYMKEVQKMEQYYTPEQLKTLHERLEKYPEKAKEIQQAWPVLFKKFEEALKAGLPVASLKVQVLAKEAELYIDLFTGGDRNIEASLEKYNKDNMAEALKVWGVSKEVYEYMEQARKSLAPLRKG